MNGTHESLSPSSDIDQSSDIDVVECIRCGSTTEDGCDCVLDGTSTSDSDYETSSDTEFDREDQPDIQVRRFQYPPQ